MATDRTVVTNLDGIIKSVDVCIGISKEAKKEYKYISILLDNGEELYWFPDDRQQIRVLQQEVELASLRK